MNSTFEEMIENAEDGGFTGELVGTMLCTEGARILARFKGSEQTKELLRSLIEAVIGREVDPRDAAFDQLQRRGAAVRELKLVLPTLEEYFQSVTEVAS